MVIVGSPSLNPFIQENYYLAFLSLNPTVRIICAPGQPNDRSNGQFTSCIQPDRSHL